MNPPTDVLVVQHVEPETTGAIGAALTGAGLRARTVRVYAGDAVPRRLEHAGLVVMGGPMGVYEQDRYPHLRDEIALIEDALAHQAPVLGVCLGSQLLAAALGARVYPGPQKELGWYPLEWLPDARRDPLFHPIAAQSLMAFHWHGDRFDAPQGARVLARSAATPVQVFSYGTQAYGLLCHLEITASLLTAIVTAFGDEARAAGRDPTAILGEGDQFLHALSEAADAVFGGWVALAARAARTAPAP
ncbi:MAG TPA: gamma-glutamyl-gamma-aminobutyrate hydrolase family protein [Gemmatimonadales bacterium]|nr:gamma-glutamyl-gamma-aminobutyrate hydrolase family protein [Gemmatimonadales bacterium]